MNQGSRVLSVISFAVLALSACGTAADLTAQTAPIPAIASVSLGDGPFFKTSTLEAVPQGWEYADKTVAPGYAYVWMVDGNTVADETGAKLSGEHFAKGATVQVSVTPLAGSIAGVRVNSGVVTIQNSPPLITSLTLAGAPFTTDAQITPVVVTADSDEDDVTLTYAWYRDGVLLAHTGASLPGSAFSSGEEIHVVITPHDGVVAGEPATSAVYPILNTPPQINSVTVAPANARLGDTLTATPNGWHDPDGDLPAYRYQWYVNGFPAPSEVNEIFTATDRGDLVHVQVTPFDAEAEGLPVNADAVAIQNTPPAFTLLMLDAAAYRVDDEITAIPAGWSDADGDNSEQYVFRWWVAGTLASETGSVLRSGFAKGQTVAVSAYPIDGYDAGAWVAGPVVTIQNTPPLVEEIEFAGAPFTTDARITPDVSAYDADGDEVVFTYAWYRNGAKLAHTGASLSGTEFSRGQQIYAVVTPHDDETAGAPFTSPTLTIANTPPRFASVTVASANPRLGDTLTATPNGWLDPDGDLPEYRYQWYVNGVAVPGAEGPSFSAFAFPDEVFVEVTPVDGMEAGEALTSDLLVIENTPPVFTSLTVAGGPPFAADAVLTAVPHGWYDADGHSEGYLFRWRVNGTLHAETGDTLAIAFTKGSEVIVSALPYDGNDYGSEVSAAPIHISNTPPVITSLSLAGAPFTTAVDIPVQVASSDLDGDTVTLAYAWYVNGALTAYTGSILPAAASKAGDTVYVEVTPYDNEDYGATATSAATTILNSPPSAPAFSLRHDGPFAFVDGGIEVAFTSQPLVDIDSEPVTYTTRWYRAGQLVTAWNDQLITSGKLGHPGDTLRVVVTASDGTAAAAAEAEILLYSRDVLALGSAHTCRIELNGTVSCVGGNPASSVLLGHGVYGKSFVPITVQLAGGAPLTGAVAIAASDNTTCAIRKQRDIACWGNNWAGQVGNGTTTSALRAEFVIQGDGQRLSGAVAIGMSPKSACAAMQDGTARCWGANDRGQGGTLTEGGNLTRASTVLDASGDPLTDVVSIRPGYYHTCALLGSGEARCFGYDWDNSLGDADPATDRINVPVPSRVMLSPGTPLTDAVALTVGWNWACATRASGAVSCWGYNASGQLGNGNVAATHSAATVIDADAAPLTQVSMLSAGESHTCALRAGKVHCWGGNGLGGVGNVSLGQVPYAAEVSAAFDKSASLTDAVAIGVGGSHSCALLRDNRLQCWGGGSFGELGDGGLRANIVSAREALHLPSLRTFDAYQTYACAVGTDQRAYCWGEEYLGRLNGNSGASGQLLPAVVGGATPLENVVDVSLNWVSTCAVLTSTEGVCWGDNQLGTKGTNGWSGITPIRNETNTANLIGLRQISGNTGHNCAVVDGAGYGEFRCWGQNYSYQAGGDVSNKISYPNPVRDPMGDNVTGATGISVQDTYSCGVAQANIYCWGQSWSGILGAVDQASRAQQILYADGTPVTGATQVATGGASACAIVNAGVVCWGQAFNGRLGDGGSHAPYSKVRPVQVVDANGQALSGITSLAGLNKSFCASRGGDGAVFCWGENDNGQLGIGTLGIAWVNHAVRVMDETGLTPLTGIKTVAGGAGTVCAMRDDGTPYCWGQNTSGQAAVGIGSWYAE